MFEEFEVFHIVILLAILIALLAFNVIFLRFAFRIKRQLWNQKQTIRLLLILVEEKTGGKHSDELEQIKRINNNSFDDLL